MIYSDYAPSIIEINSLGIGLLSNIEDLDLDKNEYLVVGEQGTITGDSRDKQYSLIVNKDSVAINSTRRLLDSANKDSLKSGGLYINDDIFCEGTIIAKNLQFNNIKFEGYDSNVLQNVLTKLNEIDPLFQKGFNSITDGIGTLGNNIFTTSFVTIGGKDKTLNNANGLNISVNPKYNINNTHISLNTNINTNETETGELAKMRIGIIGDSAISPAVISTTAGMPIEFHVSRTSDSMVKLYQNPANIGFPNYQNNPDLLPALMIDTNSCVGIGVTQIEPVTFNTYEKIGEIEDIPISITERPKLRVDTTVQLQNIVTYDYFTKSYKHLNEIFVRNNGLNFRANAIIPGNFVKGEFVFNSNLYIGRTGDNYVLEVNNVLNVKGYLNVTEEVNVKDLVVTNNATFEKETTFKNDINIIEDLNIGGDLSINTGDLYLSNTRINVSTLHPIMVSTEVANSYDINGCNILIFATDDVLNFSSGSNLVVPGRFGVGVLKEDEYNEQFNIIKRNPNIFEVLIKDSSEEVNEANVPMVYMGHLSSLNDINSMQDRSFIINTSDNNKLHNIYFYPGIDLVRSELNTNMTPPVLTIHQNKRIGINTANPRYALDVKGEILCDDIYVNQNNIVTKSVLFVLKKASLMPYADKSQDFYYLYDREGVTNYCVNINDKTGIELKGLNVKKGVNSIDGYYDNNVKLATFKMSDNTEKMAYTNQKITLGWNKADTNIGSKPLNIRNTLDEEYNDTVIRLYRGRRSNTDTRNAQFTGIDICDYETSADSTGILRDRNLYKWFMYKNHQFVSDSIDDVGPLQFGYTNGTQRPTNYGMTMYFNSRTSNYHVDINNPTINTNLAQREKNNVMQIHGNLQVYGDINLTGKVNGITISPDALQNLGGGSVGTGTGSSLVGGNTGELNDVVITGKKVAILPKKALTIGHLEKQNGDRDLSFVEHLKNIDNTNATPLLVYQNLPQTPVASLMSTADIAKLELCTIDLNIDNYKGKKKDAYEFSVRSINNDKDVGSLLQLSRFNADNSYNRAFSIYTNSTTSYMNIGLDIMKPEELGKIGVHIENSTKYLLQLTNTLYPPAINMHKAVDDNDSFWIIEAPDEQNRFVLKHGIQKHTYLPDSQNLVPAFVITEDNKFGLNVDSPIHTVHIESINDTTAVHIANKYSDLSVQNNYATIKVLNSNLEYTLLDKYTSNVEFNNKLYTYDVTSNIYLSGIKYYIDPNNLPKTDKDGTLLHDLLFTSSNFIKRSNVSVQKTINIISSNDLTITSNYKNLATEYIFQNSNVLVNGNNVYINISNLVSILPQMPYIQQIPNQNVSLHIRPNNISSVLLSNGASDTEDGKTYNYTLYNEIVTLTSNFDDLVIDVDVDIQNSTPTFLNTDLSVYIYMHKNLNDFNQEYISYNKQYGIFIDANTSNNININNYIYYNKFDVYDLDLLANIQRQIYYYTEVEGPHTIVTTNPVHNYYYNISQNDANNAIIDLYSEIDFLNAYPYGADQAFNFGPDLFTSNLKKQIITYSVPLVNKVVNYIVNLNDAYSVYNFDINANYKPFYVSSKTIVYNPHIILQNNVDFVNDDEKIYGKVNKIYSKDGGIEIISEDDTDKTVIFNVNDKGDMRVDGSLYANNSTIFANKLVVDYIQVQGDILDRGNNTMIFNYSEDMYERAFTMFSSNYIHHTSNYQLYASNYLVQSKGNINFVLDGYDNAGVSINKLQEFTENPDNVKNNYNLFKISEGDNVRFSVRDGGNVGINVERPEYHLDVNGDIKAHNNMYAEKFFGDGQNLTNVNLADRTTDMLAEGTSRLYFTPERVGAIVTASNIETSNYVLRTSNEISQRITLLQTDDILQDSDNSKKFIIDDTYDTLDITGRLRIFGSLKIMGDAVTIIEAPQSNASLFINGETRNQSIRILRPDTEFDIMSVSNYSDTSANPNIFNITNRGTIGIGTYPVKNNDKNLDYTLTVKGTIYADYFKGDGQQLTNVNFTDRDTAMLKENPEGSNLYYTSGRVGAIVTASNIEMNTFVLNVSNQLQSNIQLTCNLLINRLTTMDTNMSNYLNITSNTITQNLIDTSNVISSRITNVVSDTSNFMATTSNIITQNMIGTSNEISARITKVQENVSNLVVNLESKISQTSNNLKGFIVDTSNELVNTISKFNTIGKPYLNYKFNPVDMLFDESLNNRALINNGGVYSNIDFMNHITFASGKNAKLPDENWSKFEEVTIAGFIRPEQLNIGADIFNFSTKYRFIEDTKDLLLWYKFDAASNFTKNYGNLGSAYDLNNPLSYDKPYLNVEYDSTDKTLKFISKAPESYQEIDISQEAENQYLVYTPIIDFTNCTSVSISFRIKFNDFFSKTKSGDDREVILQSYIIDENNKFQRTNFLKISRYDNSNDDTNYKGQFKLSFFGTDEFIIEGEDGKWPTYTDEYTHFVFVIKKINVGGVNKIEIKCYRNNAVLVLQQDTTLSIVSDLKFGIIINDHIFTRNNFIGQIDDIRVYSRELYDIIENSDDDEITRLYNEHDNSYSAHDIDVSLKLRKINNNTARLSYNGNNNAINYDTWQDSYSDIKDIVICKQNGNPHQLSHFIINITKTKVNIYQYIIVDNNITAYENEVTFAIEFINNTYTNTLGANITSGTLSFADFYIYTTPFNDNIKSAFFATYNINRSLNTSVSSKLSVLTADEIDDGTKRKFLLQNGSGNKYKFDNELQINNTLIVQDLLVQGTSTIIETAVYRSENLEIISDTPTTALAVKQYGEGNIISLTNVSSNEALVVNKFGHIGIATNPSDDLVTIAGSILVDTIKASSAVIGNSITTSNIYASEIKASSAQFDISITTSNVNTSELLTSNLYTVNSVKIGDYTNATENLHIQKNGYDSFIKIDTGGTGHTAGVLLCKNNLYEGHAIHYNDDGNLYFSSLNNKNSYTNRLIIRSDNNIGIQNKLYLSNSELNTPSNGELGANNGTRIILKAGDANKLPYALGVANDSMWYAVETGYSHKFYSGVNTVMTIASNLVGIGQVTPTEALHLQRDNRDTYVKIVAGASDKTAGILMYDKNSANGYSMRCDWNNDLFFATQDSSLSFTNKVIFKNSGNVGIGVDNVNTNSKLHIGGRLFVDTSILNVPSVGILGGNDGTRIILKAGSVDTVPCALGVANDSMWYAVETGHSHKFYSGLNTVMTVASNLVGIGSVAPTEALHLQRENMNTFVRIDAGGTDKIAGLMLNNSNNTDGHHIKYDTLNNKLFFHSVTNGTGSNYLTATNSGYIGIGKTNPEYTLDVNGVVNASNFYINGKQLNLSSLMGGTSGSVTRSADWTSNLGYLTYSNVQVYPNEIRIKNTNSDDMNNQLFYDAFVNYQFNSDTTLVIDSSKNNRDATNNGGQYNFDYDNRRNSLILSSNTDMTIMSTTVANSKDWDDNELFPDLTISAWFKLENPQDGDILFQFYDNDLTQVPGVDFTNTYQTVVTTQQLPLTTNYFPRFDTQNFMCFSSSIFNYDVTINHTTDAYPNSIVQNYGSWKLFNNYISKDNEVNFFVSRIAYDTSGIYRIQSSIPDSHYARKFTNSSDEYFGEYIVIDLSAKIILNQIKLYAISESISFPTLTTISGANAPSHFRIYATNDTNKFALYDTQSDWDLIYKTEQALSQYNEITIDIINNKAYRYYALVVNKLVGNATALSFAEWQLFGTKSNMLVKYLNNKLEFHVNNNFITDDYTISDNLNDWFHFYWRIRSSDENEGLKVKINNGTPILTNSASLPPALYINKLGSKNNKGKVYVSDFRIITEPTTDETATRLYTHTAPYYPLIDSRMLYTIDDIVKPSISTINSNIIRIDKNASNYIRIDTDILRLNQSIVNLTSNVSNYIAISSNQLANAIIFTSNSVSERITGLSSVYAPLIHTHTIDSITNIKDIFNNSNLPNSYFSGASLDSLDYGFWRVPYSQDSPEPDKTFNVIVQGSGSTGNNLQLAIKDDNDDSNIFLWARFIRSDADKEWKKIQAGRSDTADKLTSNIKINNVPFDGSTDINIDASKWSNVSTSNIYFERGSVGIGTSGIGSYKLNVNGSINAFDYYTDGKITPINWNLNSNFESWFKFNGDEYAMLIDSINQTNVLINTGAVFSKDVKKLGNGSIYFNGTSAFVTIPSTVNISTMYYKNNGYGLTIAFWVRIDNVGSSVQTILEYYNGTGSTAEYIKISINVNKIVEFAIKYSTNSPISYTSTALSENVWHHVVWVISGNATSTSWNIYLNGSKLTSISNRPQFPIPNPTWATSFIGKAQSGSYLKGYLNDMRFYSKTLKDFEVSNLYNNTYIADIYTAGTVGIGTSSAGAYQLNVNGDTFINGNVFTSNVGIGTGSIGAYKLNVNGDINLNGNLYQNNNLFITSRWTKTNNDISYNSGRVSIGTNTSVASYAFNVTGDAYIQGSLTASANLQAQGDVISSFSDVRLKNITSKIDNPLEKIMNISTFKYVPNDIAKQLNAVTTHNARPQVGLSAQDVQQVLPEVISIAPFDTCNLENGEIISKSGQNYLTVSYERMIPLLIECIKELKRENIEIKNKLETLLK
jgi:hypothetical protein